MSKRNTVKISQSKAIAMAQTILRDAGLPSHGSFQGSSFKDEIRISQLFDIAYKEYWSCKRFEQSGHATEVRKYYENHIGPEFGGCRLSDVTGRGVRDWHQRLKDRPVAANRALEVLSRMFTFAQEKEWVAQGTNPCALVKAFKERKRRRYATLVEIKKIMEILDREELKIRQKRKVIFIKLLLYTGARPSSIERASWDQFQDCGDHGVLTFSGKTTEKTGEEERVVLPLPAVQLIRRMKTLLSFNNSILGIKQPVLFWKKISKEAGCPDLWMRDLRRTFATLGLSYGMDKGVIGELLNHKSAQTTNIYAKLMDDKKVESVKNIADVIDKLTNTGGK